MQVEELLKILRDGGLQDEEIKALLNEALSSLEVPAQEECKKCAEEETEDAKMDRVFGL